MLSASQKQLQIWRSLLKKKGRDTYRLFLSEGFRCTLQMLENNFLIPRNILLADQSLLETIPENHHPLCVLISEKELKQLSDTQTPQSIIGVFHIPEQHYPEIADLEAGNLLYLDRIQDPGNLGTLIRTAAWFGFNGVIFAKGSADPFQPKVVRSTAGATASLPYIFDENYSFLQDFHQKNWTIYVTILDDTARSLQNVIPVSKNIIVLGNEANGVAPECNNSDYHKIFLPHSGDHYVESLNAAITGGIVMHHFSQK